MIVCRGVKQWSTKETRAVTDNLECMSKAKYTYTWDALTYSSHKPAAAAARHASRLSSHVFQPSCRCCRPNPQSLKCRFSQCFPTYTL